MGGGVKYRHFQVIITLLLRNPLTGASCANIHPIQNVEGDSSFTGESLSLEISLSSWSLLRDFGHRLLEGIFEQYVLWARGTCHHWVYMISYIFIFTYFSTTIMLFTVHTNVKNFPGFTQGFFLSNQDNLGPKIDIVNCRLFNGSFREKFINMTSSSDTPLVQDPNFNTLIKDFSGFITPHTNIRTYFNHCYRTLYQNASFFRSHLGPKKRGDWFCYMHMRETKFRSLKCGFIMSNIQA